MAKTERTDGYRPLQEGYQPKNQGNLQSEGGVKQIIPPKGGTGEVTKQSKKKPHNNN